MKSKEEIKKYAKELIKSGNFKFDCPHKTNSKYEFEYQKERFIDKLTSYIRRSSLGMIDLLSEYCFDCGRYIHYSLENNILVAKERECFEVKPFSVEIQIPSGKLVLVDWPENGQDILEYLDDDKEPSINSFKGVVLRSQKYSQENIMHFFVGNSSPQVYYKDGLIYIGQDGYNESDEEFPLMEDATVNTSICTDLWWITAFDVEVYRNLIKKKFGEDISEEFEEQYLQYEYINVKPGIYKCTHYYNTVKSRDNRNEPNLFSKMEWIREI